MLNKNYLDQYKHIKSTLTMISPFMSSLLFNYEVRVGKSNSIAYVAKNILTKNRYLFLGNKFFEKDIEDQLFILSHEIMHLAFYDLERLKNRDMEIWNKICDCFINEILTEIYDSKLLFNPSTGLKKTIYFLKDLNLSDYLHDVIYFKITKEELYYKIPKIKIYNNDISNSKNNKSNDCNKDSYYSDIKKVEKNEGNVIQKGIEGKIDDSNYEKQMKEALSKALETSKTVGNMPRNLERIINNIINNKQDWKQILRNLIGYSKILNNTNRTYLKPNRRNYSDFILKGKKKMNKPEIWFAVDVSGSISEKELNLFLSELQSIIKENFKINLLFWDIEVTNKSLIKGKTFPDINLLGGGGTKITPVLKEINKEMKKGDIVIIATDGYVWDDNYNNYVNQINEKMSLGLIIFSKKYNKNFKLNKFHNLIIK